MGLESQGTKFLAQNITQSKTLRHKTIFAFTSVFMGCMSTEHELCPEPDRMGILMVKTV